MSTRKREGQRNDTVEKVYGMRGENISQSYRRVQRNSRLCFKGVTEMVDRIGKAASPHYYHVSYEMMEESVSEEI